MSGREPDVVLAEIRDCSARIDRIYGDADQPPEALWKGRKLAEPFDYDTAVTVMLLDRERTVLRSELPPIALVQGGPF